MPHGLRITRIWSDDDMVEFSVEVSDGASLFVNQMYVGYARLKEAANQLDSFRHQVSGGLYDLEFGGFGCEFASGALHARFHFVNHRIYITSRQESSFEEFGKKEVANSATFHIRTEPALFDRFVEELQELETKTNGEAFLECV